MDAANGRRQERHARVAIPQSRSCSQRGFRWRGLSSCPNAPAFQAGLIPRSGGKLRFVMIRLVLLAFLASPVAAQEFDFFEQKIRPVLVERCYECHSAQSEKLKGELRLDSAEGMRKGGESGQPAIVPGDVSRSLLLTAISYLNTDLQMPPKKQLRAEEVQDFRNWVLMGAPDPRTNGAMVMKKSGEHWAFKPVTAVQLPEIKDRDWPLNE